MDLVLGGLGLVLSAPILLLISGLIRATMGPPVIFRQRRPGLNGRPFLIYKFRTMREKGPDQEQCDDDECRLTALGRVLRRTSLDELPELWNVIRGDMSLVGPRPLLMEYLPLYSVKQARRHKMRPGLTGLAQVRGRNSLEWGKRFELDVWYVDNWSLRMDLRIMIWTILRVVRMEGITGGAHATMERYRGNEPSSASSGQD